MLNLKLVELVEMSEEEKAQLGKEERMRLAQIRLANRVADAFRELEDSLRELGPVPQWFEVNAGSVLTQKRKKRETSSNGPSKRKK